MYTNSTKITLYICLIWMCQQFWTTPLPCKQLLSGQALGCGFPQIVISWMKAGADWQPTSNEEKLMFSQSSKNENIAVFPQENGYKRWSEQGKNEWTELQKYWVSILKIYLCLSWHVLVYSSCLGLKNQSQQDIFVLKYSQCNKGVMLNVHYKDFKWAWVCQS